MSSQITLVVGLVSGAMINFIYCAVACDPQRRKGISPLEFLWVLYCVNFGGLLVLSPAWVTVENLQRWPGWVLFAFVGGPALFIVAMLPLAWGWSKWRPYVGR